MKKARRDHDDIGMSFLDTLSAGFGAIIMLVLLTRIVTPAVLEQSSQQLKGSVRAMQERVYAMRGEDRVLSQQLTARQQAIRENERLLAAYEAELARLKSDVPDATLPDPGGNLNDKYAVAKQTLTEEMERLLANRRIRGNAIGGIPVDSEYIIFVIDTSGSMFEGAWPLVIRKVDEALSIYPAVKGIQVMNDEGGYMFPQFRDTWIPDNPARRKAIIERMRNWNPFSDSSPVEGIEKAITTFYAPDRKISIYVFGDDFAGEGSSIRRVLATVDSLNARGADGKRRVRIHAVGFPQNFQNFGGSASAYRFAALMRELAQRNDGTFIALPSTQ